MRINYEMGGPIATAYPEGHDTMKLCWDLIGGEIFFPHNGRTLTTGVKNRAGFKREAEQFFAQVFT